MTTWLFILKGKTTGWEGKGNLNSEPKEKTRMDLLSKHTNYLKQPHVISTNYQQNRDGWHDEKRLKKPLCVLVAQLCLTLCDSMDCSLPGFSVHEIHQVRILEWVAISFSKENLYLSLNSDHLSSPHCFICEKEEQILATYSLKLDGISIFQIGSIMSEVRIIEGKDMVPVSWGCVGPLKEFS